MRPFVLACAAAVAAFFGSGSLHAQDWLRQAIPPENRTHNFGTVARAAKTEHRFYITNVHSSDLHIRSVRASCGCTTPIVETEWIKPGETGSILARFNTGTFTGAKSATLTVSIDKPHFTELQLNVRGYIRSDVVFSPGEINFGEVPVGEPKTIDVTLNYAGRSDWQLLDVESPLEFVDVDFQQVSRSGGQIQYKISASLKESAPAGLLQNQLLLRTNDRNLTTVPLRFSAAVQNAIQVRPEAFALGTVKPGEPLAQRLTIKAQRPFRVLAIRSQQAEIHFAPTPTAKTAHLLNLTILPTAPRLEGEPQPGEVTGEVQIVTDLSDDPLPMKLNFTIQTHTPAAENVVQAN
ncbi:MAG: DUF1573 domain-containing protein [Planctomycetales bacterium]|nr:DUF1573 domain-containing protein [Planctomycetales bacterium]